MEKTYDAVILAAGDYPTHPIALAALTAAPFLCCCDGAARAAIDHGLMPHAIVGDGDSLPADLRQRHADIVHTVAEQEYNDLTKATRFVIQTLAPQGQASPLSIAYLGCTGRREDHTLGNISLMAFYMREFHIRPTLYTNHGVLVPCQGTQTFRSFPGQQVSIFNLTATALASEGLKWGAYPYAEWWQGTLNESTGEGFTLRADGTFLVFQTYEAKSTPSDAANTDKNVPKHKIIRNPHA